MDKILLTVEEANEIHDLMIDFEQDKYEVIQYIVGKNRLIHGTEKNLKLVNAVLNGYEIKQTPEGVILDHYNYISDKLEKTSMEDKDWNVLRNIKSNIEFILDTLQIKIEGIN